jgi:ankyrin repeat protein
MSKKSAVACYAAMNNSVESLEFLLKDKSKNFANEIDFKGKTPLMYACEFGCEEAVLLLLKSEAKPEVLDKTGKSALWYACAGSCDNLECIKMLVYRTMGHSNCLNKVDREFSEVPLIKAAQKGKWEACQLLVNVGAAVDVVDKDHQNLLMIICDFFNPPPILLVRTLVDAGINVNFCDAGKHTAMFRCVQRNHVDVANFLKEKGAKTDVSNSSGEHLMDHAKLTGNMADGKLFEKSAEEKKREEALADVAVTPVTKNNPIYAAACRNSIGTLEFLSQDHHEEDDINTQDWTSRTPLMGASMKGSNEAMQLLISKKACVHSLDNDNRSALWYACAYEGNDETVNILLNNGANCCINKVESKFNETPVASAAMNKKYAAVKNLLDHGAYVNSTDREGHTLLARACEVENPNMEYIEFLISKKADVNNQCKDGNTALILATKMQNKQVIDILMKNGADDKLFNKFNETVAHIELTYNR